MGSGKLTSCSSSGNKDKDSTVDDTMTGDLNNQNTVAGEGSHFGSSRTTGNDPLSSSTNPTSGTGTRGLSEPYSSRMPGSFDDDAATTASVSSGVPGRAQTRNAPSTGAYDSGLDTNKPLPSQPSTSNTGLTGSGVAGSGGAAGPYSSNLENKLDPRVDSDLDGRRGLSGNTTSATGSGVTGNTAAPQSQGLGSNTESGRSFPLGGSSGTETNMGSGTGYAAPGQVGTYPAGGVPGGSAGTGSGLGSNAGPHSSNLENKLDPRVDSNLDGRSGFGNTGTGGTANTATGYGSGTGPTAASGNSGYLGRDTVAGGAAGGAASGLGPESWEHKHGSHSQTYEGDPCGPDSTVSGAPHFTAGPHATDTANRLDPHVASDIRAPGSTTGTSSGSGLGSSATGIDRGLGASTTGPGTGFGSSTAETSTDPYGSSATGSSHRAGRDTALGTGAGVGGVGAYEAGRDNTQSSSTGPAPNTAGPHKSDMLNKLDPRIDSDLSKQQSGTTGTAGTTSGFGSSTTASDPYGSSASTGHHTGRDAVLTGGAGAAAYEAEKHHNQHEPTSTTGTSGLASSTTTGQPHHSHHQAHRDRQQHASEHHHGRDAGLAGAGTAAGYEAERHHGHPTQSSTVPSTTSGMTSSSRDPMGSGYDNQTGTGHHYGRDAGLAGVGAGGAYEAEKHLGHHHDTAGERLAGSGHQPGMTTQATGPTGLTGDTGMAGMQSSTTYPSQHDHHLGRDAALGAGAGGAAYETEKHHHNKHDPTTTTGTTSSQDPQHHLGRDAGLGAGVAGAGYEADKHHQDKEAKKLEHEREREQHHESGKKSGGIMGLFHRDKGDKDAKKEERAEEKAERKAEHGHHTGRDATLGAGAAGTAYEADKHHQHTRGPGDEEMAAGAGATGLESDMRNTNLEGQHQPQYGAGHTMTGSRDYEHGSQAGTHDSAISSGSGVAGITTHDAYGEQDPNSTNRLHKKNTPADRGL